MPARAPELSAAPGADRGELKRTPDGKLVPVIYAGDLREHNHVTDAPMRQCIAQYGPHASGSATLAFTVAARGGKLVIESTAIQDDEIQSANPKLLECMHRTALALTPSLEGRPIPELGTAIYVRRHVRLDRGDLVENSIFDFSYSH
jgi:hypothetical protein